MGASTRPEAAQHAGSLVIDTNIVLDLFVFEDPATVALRHALAVGAARWLSTQAMRDELERVLAYPLIARRQVQRAMVPQDVLAQFDGAAQLVGDAPKAAYTCKDADDQKFVDLAVAHHAMLLSKDAAVLCMARRLARLGVGVEREWLPAPLVARSA